MTPTATALRAGWSRGLIELRQSFTNGAELWGHFFWPMLMVIATFCLRDVSFGSSGFLLGPLVLPSILGMNVALGMISMSQQLTAEREDGTLLRAKAIRTECWDSWSARSSRCPAAWSLTWRSF
jgi:ABC-2 type transport system permease protein